MEIECVVLLQGMGFNVFHRALCWNDSTASLKATNLTSPMVRQLSSDGSLTPDVASHIMTSVLQALQLHGQHEANLGSLLMLGAQIYEILRPLFPNIIEVCAVCVFMNRIINQACVSALSFSSCLRAVPLLSKNRFHCTLLLITLITVLPS
jgi:hypothetical protein